MMKKITITHSIALAGILCFSSIGFISVANANAVEEAAQACKDAAKLIQEEDDLEGAIEEATWCLTGLKQLQEEIKLSLLPDELMGFSGGDIDNQSLMGMNVIEREYTKDNKSISLTLTTTSGAGAAAGGLGALAELGKLFGAVEGAGVSGGKKVRIQKRTAVASDSGGVGQLIITLKSGGSLKVLSNDMHSDELTDFMREFPLIELDDAMAN